jgi:hypothetical protein
MPLLEYAALAVAAWGARPPSPERTLVTHYIAVLVEAQSGHWRARFPDAPDCEALEYGLANAKRAVAENLERYSEGGGAATTRARVFEAGRFSAAVSGSPSSSGSI